MGRPRVHHEERVATAVRVPKTLHDRVRAAAQERQVGVNFLVVRALEEYLDRLVPVDELVRTRDSDPGGVG
jgi:predicted HicB family RNase H-like nuclease